ncbi:MAG: type II secretion system protein [Leptolyngbya sp. PLA2]|nr:type II secretion system protein [Leptolyngbya sp.]MCE7971772.1 type II secretion system protein [Leptolyngbya sp. PL-A2]MCZ7634413.1 type II secretion system GspH family protein [Phycisphaerales bacterium]MDL1904790.1 type II secretion system protein [Synechococcales cyanobacterium CNB]GIK19729.1 MAG: hypothetical protein BroJett004_18930 [Planctomycetota bacterium]
MPRRAFTLLEMILVVLLTALVTGLLLPTLGHVRASARDTVSVANTRSHAQVLAAYAADWDDYFPAFADPKAKRSVIRGCNKVIVFPYFHTVYLWQYALCEDYYSGVLKHRSFLHPAADPDPSPDDPKNIGINYLLSSAFLAAPAYWEPETRTGPSQWCHSRLSSASFPAQKALITEIHPVRWFPHPGVEDGIGLAFVDGSAGRFAKADLIEPYPNGEGSWDGTWLPIGIYGMHTIRGWDGRDRR